MSDDPCGKALAFKDLHSAPGLFVMPNAWNAGSACMLEAAGFSAIGTTSAGIEDFAASYGTGKLYERDHCVERVRAAKSAAPWPGRPLA